MAKSRSYRDDYECRSGCDDKLRLHDFLLAEDEPRLSLQFHEHGKQIGSVHLNSSDVRELMLRLSQIHAAME